VQDHHKHIVNALTAAEASKAAKDVRNTELIFLVRPNANAEFRGWSESKSASDEAASAAVMAAEIASPRSTVLINSDQSHFSTNRSIVCSAQPGPMHRPNGWAAVAFHRKERSTFVIRPHGNNIAGDFGYRRRVSTAIAVITICSTSIVAGAARSKERR